MYYNQNTDTYYENEQNLLRMMVFNKGLYKKGFIKWLVKTKENVEVFPNVVYTKKTFEVYYFDTGKIRKAQTTVFQINEKPLKKEYYTVEKVIEKMLLEKNCLTEYGKNYYQQVLIHFQTYLSIDELQNNLFFFKEV